MFLTRQTADPAKGTTTHGSVCAGIENVLLNIPGTLTDELVSFRNTCTLPSVPLRAFESSALVRTTVFVFKVLFVIALLFTLASGNGGELGLGTGRAAAQKLPRPNVSTV